MGILMSERFNSLGDVFEHELKDMYDAEMRIAEALPQMADKAHNPNLKRAFQDHKRQTDTHVQRLESVFKHCNIEPDRVKCDGVAGIISEGSDVLTAEGDQEAIDAALIGSAQKVEHYEMAAYGTLRTFAQHLGNSQAAQLLEQTLEEEKATDKKLTQIAEAAVNPASV